MFHLSRIVAAGMIFAAQLSCAPAQAAPLAHDAQAASAWASSSMVLQAGLGPCHWTKVCVEKKIVTGHDGYWGYHCLKWEQKKVCNPGSEKPQSTPPKVHVPPFERRLQLPGPSLGRQRPVFNQGAPSFGRGIQRQGSGGSIGRR